MTGDNGRYSWSGFAQTVGVGALTGGIFGGAGYGVATGLSRVTALNSTRTLAADTAARSADEAGALVRYDPQELSRRLLGQVGDGFATTPGGRTVSAYAAERIAIGAPGRPPTTLARVDDILDNPTKLRYDPVRDTVRVSQGRAWVVVRGGGSDQHIVTVMIPGRR